MASMMMASPKPVAAKGPVATREIRAAAAQYLGAGHDALDPEVLEEAREEVRRRIVEAESWGFTPRDVVGSLFRTLSGKSHCGCPSCQVRCPVCATLKS